MDGLMQINQAVILAGGRGERLRPLTNNLPKPMVPVNERPFLEYLVERLRVSGITEIVMLLGYLPEKITEYFGDGGRFGLRIRYSIGTVDDETGTRVRNAKALLADRFLLMYGDNYWPLPLDEMTCTYEKMAAPVMVTVYNNRDGRGEYGFRNNIHMSKDGYVLSYGAIPAGAEHQGVDIGFFLLDKGMVPGMPAHNFSFEKEFLPRLITRRQLVAFRTNEPYYTITTLEMVEATGRILRQVHRSVN
ncbi:MAG: hypothetical protein C4528_03300 [Gammaproteobacteria bacterium]|nr:MAG: hypothetical protein C4528_03300 [Gammaproteobacteria bacterium]